MLSFPCSSNTNPAKDGERGTVFPFGLILEELRNLFDVWASDRRLRCSAYSNGKERCKNSTATVPSHILEMAVQDLGQLTWVLDELLEYMLCTCCKEKRSYYQVLRGQAEEYTRHEGEGAFADPLLKILDGSGYDGVQLSGSERAHQEERGAKQDVRADSMPPGSGNDQARGIQPTSAFSENFPGAGGHNRPLPLQQDSKILQSSDREPEPSVRVVIDLTEDDDGESVSYPATPSRVDPPPLLPSKLRKRPTPINTPQLSHQLKAGASSPVSVPKVLPASPTETSRRLQSPIAATSSRPSSAFELRKKSDCSNGSTTPTGPPNKEVDAVNEHARSFSDPSFNPLQVRSSNPNNLSEMKKLLRSPIERNGYVYILTAKFNSVPMVKIGVTSNVEKRIQGLSKGCCEAAGLNFKEYERRTMMHKERVEALVHKELDTFKLPSKWCKIAHREFFEVCPEVALQSVERWKRFVDYAAYIVLYYGCRHKFC
jgi:T5orf172 domain